jgi:hypothetical protein
MSSKKFESEIQEGKWIGIESICVRERNEVSILWDFYVKLDYILSFIFLERS